MGSDKAGNPSHDNKELEKKLDNVIENSQLGEMSRTSGEGMHALKGGTKTGCSTGSSMLSLSEKSENEGSEHVIAAKSLNIVDPNIPGSDLHVELKVDHSNEDKFQNVQENNNKDEIQTRNWCTGCENFTRCKYSVTNKNEKQYLCSRSCFENFKNATTTTSFPKDGHEAKQKQVSRSPAFKIVVSCPVLHLYHFDFSKLVSDQILERCKTCITCGNRILGKASAPSIVEGFRNFCNKACSARYQKFFAKDGGSEYSESTFHGVTCGDEKCVICGAAVKDAAHEIHYGELHYNFCSLTCINTFKAKNETVEECFWCHDERPIFDMLHCGSSQDSHRRFCSLTCLSLFRLKQHSHLSDLLHCDNCQKSQPAYYHVKMSDSSIRSFCCYACVKAFRNKFKVQTKTSDAKNRKEITSCENETPSSAPDVVVVKQLQQVAKLKSKSLLCKPVLAKYNVRRPQMDDRATQTDEDMEHKVIVPCPVPTVVPSLLHPLPPPIPTVIPVVVPVPYFVQTQKNSSANISKKPKEFRNDVLSGGYEVDLASEAVNPAEVEGSDEGNADHSEPGEDMLQIALRMANEMTQEDQVIDLENATVQDVKKDNKSVTIALQQTDAPSVAQDVQKNDVDKGRESTNVDVFKENVNGIKRHRTEEQRMDGANEQSQNPKPLFPGFSNDNIFALKFSYGVNAYKHWVLNKNAAIESSSKKISSNSLFNKGPRLFKVELLEASNDELSQTLSHFVKEVRKPDGEEYAPDSILYLCLGIQEYLHMHGRVDNIFSDVAYEKFSNSLNDVLIRYEVRLDSEGMLVCRIEEEHLWECKQLGAYSPHVLVSTLVYFNTKYFLLKTPQQHVSLSFSSIIRQCRKTANKNGKNIFLRYCSPGRSGSSESHQKKRKDDVSLLEQSENLENPMRCPVKLYEFYISKCPESIKNRSDLFYLLPEMSCIPDSPVWYTSQPFNLENMSKIFNRLQIVREIQEAILSNMIS